MELQVYYGLMLVVIAGVLTLGIVGYLSGRLK